MKKNLLNEFFNSKSDANINLEAFNQEKLENDFQNFIESKSGESNILELTNSMCEESLDPETFQKWENVINSLQKTRGIK